MVSFVRHSLIRDLTQSEAHEALRAASRRHPALSFAVQASGDAVLPDDEQLFELAIDEDDFERYRDIVDEIVRRVRPVRLRMRDVENELAALVLQVLESPPPWRADAKPINQIGALFEWRIVPYLLDYGDFVDGFYPTSVEPLLCASARGVALAGTCGNFKGRDAPFEAEIALNDNGALIHFELRFGDASFVAIERGIIPGDAPDVAERVVSGYRTVVRRSFGVARSEEGEQEWPFLIVMQSR